MEAVAGIKKMSRTTVVVVVDGFEKYFGGKSQQNLVKY